MYKNRNKLHKEIKKKLKSSGLEYWMRQSGIADWNWNTGDVGWNRSRQTGTEALDEADCVEPKHWMRQSGSEALDEVERNRSTGSGRLELEHQMRQARTAPHGAGYSDLKRPPASPTWALVYSFSCIPTTIIHLYSHDLSIYRSIYASIHLSICPSVYLTFNSKFQSCFFEFVSSLQFITNLSQLFW